MKNKLLIGAMVSGVVTFSLQAQAVPSAPAYWEKCAGIAKQGKNDCGALDGAHGCSGQAPADNLDTEWVYVPKGTCEKITGGRVAKIKPAKT